MSETKEDTPKPCAGGCWDDMVAVQRQRAEEISAFQSKLLDTDKKMHDGEPYIESGVGTEWDGRVTEHVPSEVPLTPSPEPAAAPKHEVTKEAVEEPKAEEEEKDEAKTTARKSSKAAPKDEADKA